MELNGSFCSLWNTNDNNALVDACRSHAKIQIRCAVPQGKELVDTMLDGYLATINGLNGIMIVTDTTVLSEKGHPGEDQCSFSIKMKKNLGKSPIEKGHVITGVARIQIIDKDQKENIKKIFIRFDRCYTVRPLRGNQRYKWQPSFSRLFRVILPITVPNTREQLSTILREQSNYIISSHPLLVDISAGGLCACLPKELAQTSFSAKNPYLIFFLSEKAATNDPPYIFLAKRLGIGGADCCNGIPIRMRFMAEMDWSSNGQKLRWFDIREEGSPRLRKHLSTYVQFAAD